MVQLWKDACNKMSVIIFIDCLIIHINKFAAGISEACEPRLTSKECFARQMDSGDVK